MMILADIFWYGIYAISIVAAIFLLLPFLVFLLMKIGTYGYYKGRKTFENQEEKDNG
jgi:hypothetical protein